MEQTLDILREMLTKAGLKATGPRLLVLQTVLEGKIHHPNAEQVYEVVKQKSPSVTLATVYKNLESLVQANLINRVWSEDGQKRFDTRHTDHAHIHCTNTKEIIDYHDHELNELIVNYFRKKKVSNLKIRNISLHITGEKLDPDKKVHIK